MAYKVNFRKFRTFPCLEYAIKCYCNKVKESPGGLRAVCPRQDCKAKQRVTMNNRDKFELAFCHSCRRPIDAIQILVEVLGCTPFEAAWELERFLIDA